MTRLRILSVAAILFANSVVVYGALGPCNITVPAGFVNTIACTGSIVPPLPPGCAGAAVITVQQKKCANLNSTPCTDVPINLFVIRPALLVGTWIVGPCYGVTGPPTPGVWSYNCTQGAPIAIPGGNNC
jgi:hypothetical protein